MSSTTPQPGVTPTVDVDSRFRSGTPVGVDVGLRNLLALAPASAGSDIIEGRIVGDARIEVYYATLRTRPADDRVTAILTERLRRLVEDVAREAVAYAQSFDMPILAVEDLGYPERELEECIENDADVACWLFPAVLNRVVSVARADGIPVIETSRKYTTRQCHVCKQFARVGDETIECTTDDCPVDEVCRDLSAAATVAGRVV